MFTLLQKRALFENRCRSFVRVHIPVKISIFDRTCCKIWMRTRRRSEAARQLKRPRSKYFLWKSDEFFGTNHIQESYLRPLIRHFGCYHVSISSSTTDQKFFVKYYRSKIIYRSHMYGLSKVLGPNSQNANYFF
jgi:hypothetical protein